MGSAGVDINIRKFCPDTLSDVRWGKERHNRTLFALNSNVNFSKSGHHIIRHLLGSLQRAPVVDLRGPQFDFLIGRRGGTSEEWRKMSSVVLRRTMPFPEREALRAESCRLDYIPHRIARRGCAAAVGRC